MSHDAEHARRIRRALADIRAAWPDMLPVLARAPIGPAVSTVPASKPPVNIGALSARRYVCERLASWVLLVLTDTEDKPVSPIDGTDAPGMCAYLDHWADFLAAHDAAEDAVEELEDDARRCEAIAQGLRKRRFEVGQCIAHDTSDLGERIPCEGRIVADLSTGQATLPVLRCTLDTSHTWDGSQWGEIARMPVRIEEAARITRVPARSIRAWIEDGSLVAVVETRPRLVRLSDVTRRAASRVV